MDVCCRGRTSILKVPSKTSRGGKGSIKVQRMVDLPSEALGVGQPSLLSNHLLAAGVLSAAALERAERVSSAGEESLGSVLTRLGLVPERDLAEALAALTGLAVAKAEDFPVAPVLDGSISRKYLKRIGAIPLALESDALLVAMTDPEDAAAAEALSFAAERPVRRLVACMSDVEAAWQRLYGADGPAGAGSAAGQDDAAAEDAQRVRDLASDAPVIRLVNQLIQRAVEARASDIHLEPMADRLRVRLRIDGALQEIEPPPARLRSAIVSRLKIMAKLNIAERRLAQDGRIRLAVRGQEIDLRVATTPSVHGEGVVLRILDRSSLTLDFAALGFDETLIAAFDRLLARPHGIILATGPTGSGKTTTLYAALTVLNSTDRKILTIEDPVEYELDGISQLQVLPQIGRGFATALRSFLRQDPDVMMVGEIRDLETAQVAVQAALTGHLILSTLHTNSAASAVTRLLDMGVDDYLLTSTLEGLIAQRLVRTLCPACRAAETASPELVRRWALDRLTETRPILLWREVGCSDCGHTGYRGRSSIVEVLTLSDAIRQLVLGHAEAREIERQAVAEGMRPMQVHGLTKALQGETTVAEVLRATSDS
jgi:general secretion pathway protein E